MAILSCRNKYDRSQARVILPMAAVAYLLHWEQSGISVGIGRCRTKTLMKQVGISVRYRKPYKVTTNSTHRNRTYPNLLVQNFKVSRINQVWVSDITYIRTAEGWLYLAVVIDLYARKIVGWANQCQSGLQCITAGY